MQILNIVLLVLSVFLGVVGIVLIRKPSPMYTLAYPEKTAKKVSYVAFFTMLALGTSLYFLSAALGIDQRFGIAIYLISLLVFLTIYLKWYYSVISKETERKNRWK